MNDERLLQKLCLSRDSKYHVTPLWNEPYIWTDMKRFRDRRIERLTFRPLRTAVQTLQQHRLRQHLLSFN